MRELTHLSLFSGIGGLDLAAEMAGFRTVGQCEWADYPTKVLEKHWPDVPRWRDIRTLTGESFYEQTGLRTVDVISGGFPCQPFSVAGKRRGKEDDRYLWPEMLRVISEIRPAWVVGENVAGIVSMALDQVLSDLESIGYACQSFVIPACAVDAPHRRDRVAIVGRNANRGNEQTERQICAWKDTKPGGSGDDVADTSGKGLQGRKFCGTPDKGWQTKPCGSVSQCCEDVSYAKSTKRPSSRAEAWKRRPKSGCSGWWTAEPDVGRVAHGVPHRVDRLRCLGNAVVPQQFQPIFESIKEVEQ